VFTLHACLPLPPEESYVIVGVVRTACPFVPVRKVACSARASSGMNEGMKGIMYKPSQGHHVAANRRGGSEVMKRHGHLMQPVCSGAVKQQNGATRVV